jgi:hypothetical protein
MPYLDFLIKELNNNGSEVIDIIKSLSIDQVIVWVKYSQANQMPIDGIVENDSVKFLRALLYDEGKKGVIRLHFWTKSLNVASYFDRGSIHRDRFNAVSKAFAGLKMLDIRFKTTAIQSLKSSQIPHNADIYKFVQIIPSSLSDKKGANIKFINTKEEHIIEPIEFNTFNDGDVIYYPQVTHTVIIAEPGISFFVRGEMKEDIVAGCYIKQGSKVDKIPKPKFNIDNDIDGWNQILSLLQSG